ncbi:MAG: alpha/beta fold hydrolase [Nostoc sp.]|uniref:alpha/beta fold hydrolase n=1 Tax=Nostoc sp. TaxID=1180 RepID=UPI002FF984D7
MDTKFYTPSLQERIVSFTSKDGFPCNLINIRGEKTPSKPPVLLVHGAGVRANIFRAPVQTNLGDYLVAHGYDVWLENWRASTDLTPNHWTLDQAAVYDHPQAVKTIVQETGCQEIKAIIHCQGSTSFMMSAIAGLVPQVKTIISNAVSLHPIVPLPSSIKIKWALPSVRLLTDHLNPQWGLHSPTLVAKLISLYVSLTHHECNNPVCKQVSFTYGSGFPALWEHENLNEATHEWLKQEFAYVPLSFFAQISDCISRGHLVSVEDLPNLPQDFIAQPPQTDARIAFFAGKLNRCFLPQSQIETFKYFNAIRPNYHSLHLLHNYSHLDIFMGKNAAIDVFPLMLAELEKTI